MLKAISLSSLFREHPRPVFLFSLSVLTKCAVFVFLLWWFRVAGHLPDFGGNFPILGGDSSDYGQLTRNLFSSGTFSSSDAPPLIPESFRLPGYSFFLYPFFFLPFPLIFGVLAQILLASATIVLTYLFGKKFLSEKAGFIAAFLLIFEPTSIINSVSVMSDTVFVFSLLLSIYLLLTPYTSKKRFVAISLLSGALLGYAVLVRVIAQYLALCILGLYLFYTENGVPLRDRLLRVLLFIVASICIVLPWSLRNHELFETYTISSTPYINFTQYNLVYFYAYQHHTTPPEVQHLFSDPIPYPTTSFWFRSLINEPIFQKEMHDGLSGNIVPYAEFHLFKTLPFFLNDGLRDANLDIGLFPQPPGVTNFTDLLLHRNFAAIFHYFLTPTPDLVMLLLGSTFWITVSGLWILTSLYIICTRKKEWWFVLLASGIICYFAVLSSPVIQPRYRIPAAPFMLLMATYGAQRIRDTLYKKTM